MLMNQTNQSLPVLLINVGGEHQSIEHEENWREVNKMYLKAPSYQQACRLVPLHVSDFLRSICGISDRESIGTIPYIHYNHEWGWIWLKQ